MKSHPTITPNSNYFNKHLDQNRKTIKIHTISEIPSKRSYHTTKSSKIKKRKVTPRNVSKKLQNR